MASNEDPKLHSRTCNGSFKKNKVILKRKGNIGKKKYNPSCRIRTTNSLNSKTVSALSKKTSAGLPSFRKQHDYPKGSDGDDKDEDSGCDSFQGDDDDVPSETLVAIHSLIQTDQGLSIPLTNQVTIQALLEHQIYSTFDENNSTNINRDLLELVRTNKIRQLYCQDKSRFAYVLTHDYIQAVWDVGTNSSHLQLHDEQNDIISWFVTNLQNWTGRNTSQSAMEAQWEVYCENSKKADSSQKAHSNESATLSSFETVVQLLLNLQLIIRDTQRSTLNVCHENQNFFLWLPQWAVVLKSWREAQQRLLSLLARAKETSKMNLLRQNRHSYISTQFLLQDLTYQGKVMVIERPFGSFVQLARNKK
jgi:hypothetical protein